jgi:hypothetical protein
MAACYERDAAVHPEHFCKEAGMVWLLLHG